jgi:AraC-like DNA-binding protein
LTGRPILPCTLNRRLNAFGIDFQELVDEGRFEIAGRHTDAGREIAVSLDYADASALTRAFPRWTGTSPGLAQSLR